MNNGCYIYFGKKRHQYKPRYDLIMPFGELQNFKGSVTAFEAMKNKIYVRDICVRCGHTVERGTKYVD